MTGGQKASDLRASAAIALARIAGKETYDAFKALAEKETAAQGVFGRRWTACRSPTNATATSPATARS